VLYVPHNWWHFVESVSEVTISLNSWIELKKEDNYSRLKEIITKTMIQSVMDSNLIGFDKWINSSEEYTEQENNIEILKEILSHTEQEDDSSTYTEIDFNFKSLVESHPNFLKFFLKSQFDEYISQFTLKPNSSSED